MGNVVLGLKEWGKQYDWSCNYGKHDMGNYDLGIVFKWAQPPLSLWRFIYLIQIGEYLKNWQLTSAGWHIWRIFGACQICFFL